MLVFRSDETPGHDDNGLETQSETWKRGEWVCVMSPYSGAERFLCIMQASQIAMMGDDRLNHK
jgi:hypothetical protein